jgi:hypothetical protein
MGPKERAQRELAKATRDRKNAPTVEQLRATVDQIKPRAAKKKKTAKRGRR